MPRPVSLPRLFDVARDAMTENIYTAMPARVTTYDPETNTITAQPVMKRAIFTKEDEVVYEELPPIPNVPVGFYRMGGYIMTFPIYEGDTVLLVFSQVSTSEWRSTGQDSEPLDTRRHGISDPVAIPIVWPDTNPLPSEDLDNRAKGLVLGREGGKAQIHCREHSNAPDDPGDPEILLGVEATDFVALSTPTMADLNALKTSVNALITQLAIHTHSGVTSGSAVTGLPGNATEMNNAAVGTLAGVAATVAKAK